MVHDFLRQKQEEDPERFREVCQDFPVLSGRQWRRIRERETPLTPSIALEHGVESGYSEDDNVEW